VGRRSAGRGLERRPTRSVEARRPTRGIPEDCTNVVPASAR
jgi:hypothetical protein